MEGFVVNKPGVQTTVQDAGRFGYQWSGISPAGAMDIRSLRIANLLVDNDMDEAGLEITVIGPELLFLTPQVIAVTGADLSPTLNGTPIPRYSAVSVLAGDILRFGARKSGCRSYLAFAGGLDIEPVMGSRSTLLRNKLGSLGGCALKKGDMIGFRVPTASLPNQSQRVLEPEKIENEEVMLRVIMGPQDDCFTESGIATFLSDEGYQVTSEFSRQGYRLEGPRIKHVAGGDIVSDGIAMGSIQVPSNGLPIVMLAERQSTGGYTKIANVISVDLPKIGQCLAGSKIRFQAISIEEAQLLMRKESEYLQSVKQQLSSPPVDTYYKVYVNGKQYSVKIQRTN